MADKYTADVYTSEDAWQAFGKQDFELAGQIWQYLVATAGNDALRTQYRFNYTYVLLAQGRFTEAQDILQELYQASKNPIYLHQMGCVARESGDLNQARLCLIAEKARLNPLDYSVRAANSYELGLVALLLNELPQAHNFARDSLNQARRAGDCIAEGTAHRLLGDVMMAIQKDGDARQHYQAAFLAYGASKTLQPMHDALNSGRHGSTQVG